MRFHVLGLPHTQTTRVHSACAYTQKIRVFCQMMMSRGHEVYHYGAEGSNPICTEHIDVISAKDQNKYFGKKDWSKQMYDISYNAKEPYWRLMNKNIIKELAPRIKHKDFICVIAGECQKEVADAFPNNMSVEYGVGYKGGFSNYKVYESYAWMHYIYGQNRLFGGKHYDGVVPNYYDPADFPLGNGKGDYLMFIGRMIPAKMPNIAADIAREKGLKLVMAGQGIKNTSNKNGEKVYHGEGVTIIGNHIDFKGCIGIEERAQLMGNAKAVIVYTEYVGPFEGVHAEAMMCGTPVITPDYGCFTETVVDGFNGYRCRTFGECLWAVDQVDKLNRYDIKQFAESRYSTNVVAIKFENYFKQLLGLYDGGWYNKNYDPKDRNRS